MLISWVFLFFSLSFLFSLVVSFLSSSKSVIHSSFCFLFILILGLDNYTFPPLFLPSNGFWVISFYWEDFKVAYGQYANDSQVASGIGTKKNGDRFRLVSPTSHVIHDLNFGTQRPWTKFADGEGFTLVARPEFYQKIASLPPNSGDDQAR